MKRTSTMQLNYLRLCIDLNHIRILASVFVYTFVPFMFLSLFQIHGIITSLFFFAAENYFRMIFLCIVIFIVLIILLVININARVTPQFICGVTLTPQEPC